MSHWKVHLVAVPELLTILQIVPQILPVVIELQTCHQCWLKSWYWKVSLDFGNGSWPNSLTMRSIYSSCCDCSLWTEIVLSKKILFCHSDFPSFDDFFFLKPLSIGRRATLLHFKRSQAKNSSVGSKTITETKLQWQVNNVSHWPVKCLHLCYIVCCSTRPFSAICCVFKLENESQVTYHNVAHCNSSHLEYKNSTMLTNIISLQSYLVSLNVMYVTYINIIFVFWDWSRTLTWISVWNNNHQERSSPNHRRIPQPVWPDRSRYLR